MGSILKRRSEDGTIGYSAIVRVKKAGVVSTPKLTPLTVSTPPMAINPKQF